MFARTISMSLLLAMLAPGVSGQEPAKIEPDARAVLDGMVKAYRTLHSLDQETTYAGGSVIKAHLIMDKPNRLLFETTERSVTKSGPVVRRFLSDGKEMYSYTEENGYYTREKAPHDLAGFKELASTIELAALTGVDPIRVMAQGARSAKLVEPAVVDGVETDVVAMDMSTEDRTGEVRFYVGRQDHLLRRFTLDTRWLPRPAPKLEPEKPADTPVDPTLPPLEPLEPLGPPLPTHFAYDNRILSTRDVARDSFRWITPAGALLYTANVNVGPPKKRKPGEINGMILAQPVDTSEATDPVDTSQPTRRIHARDLIKKAQKQKQ